jgi:c(7)-type cytochrome triheme protein
MPLINASIGIRFATVMMFAAVGLCAALAGSFRVAESSPQSQQPAPGQNFSNFSHRSNAHAQQACTSCHQRTDNSATPRFPGHSACTNCHLQQFVNPQAPMCTLCHANMSSVPPPLLAFPTKFKESFNVRFDHAQHNAGSARPANGCASCHAGNLRRGVAMAIPAGINAHNNCYSCHTPGSTSAFGRDISGCATCHTAAPFRRTSTNALAFSRGFRHSTHGARQKLNCASCHNLAAGKAQGLQVSSPKPVEHTPMRGSSCATCHNDKRAFGELADCKKCHTGPTFSFGR